MAVFDHLRRKRNVVSYDDTGFVSRAEAEQALEFGRDLIKALRADIEKRRPAAKAAR